MKPEERVSFLRFGVKRKAVVLLLLLFGIIAYRGYSAYSDFAHRKEAFRELEENIRVEKEHFSGEAGIVIKDLRNRWEITFHQNEKFPSASLVKVPLMVAVFHAAKEKRIDLGESIHLKDSYKVGGSGLLKNTPQGKSFTVKELIELMIVESDNTATNMLIDRLAFPYFNATFKELGLQHTNIVRGMMDFSKRRRGLENYTTARDISMVLSKIYDGAFISRRASKTCLTFLKNQKSKDRIPARLPPDIVIAHKTGLERGICHDAGIVFSPKGDFLICVLTRHHHENSKIAKRFISNIALLTYQSYRDL